MKKIFWTIVEVNFVKPIPNEDDGMPNAIGFYQTFGCTAQNSESMKEQIKLLLYKTEWLKELNPNINLDVSIIDNEDVQNEVLLDSEINRYLLSSPYDIGIWYQSGRIYFHEEDSDIDSGFLINITPNDNH